MLWHLVRWEQKETKSQCIVCFLQKGNDTIFLCLSHLCPGNTRVPLEHTRIQSEYSNINRNCLSVLQVTFHRSYEQRNTVN